MDFTYRQAQGVDILELGGRFDAYEVPVMIRWFDEHPQANRVIVNLKGVVFVDSSGLSTLVKGLKRCRQNGGELYLSDLQQAVLIIFELMCLDRAFRIYDTEAEALQSFAS